MKLLLKIGVLLVFILLAEYGIDVYLELNNANPSFRLGKTMIAKIRNLKNQNKNILIVGDSSCNAGIDEEVIEKITGFSVAKFAPPARYAQMSGYYFLKEYLENNKAPKILVDIRTPSLMSQRWEPTLFYDNFFNVVDFFGLLQARVINLNDFFFSQIPNVLISYRNRFAIKRIFGEKIKFLQHATLYKLQEEKSKPSVNTVTIGLGDYQKPYKKNKGQYVFNVEGGGDFSHWDNALEVYWKNTKFTERSKRTIHFQIGVQEYIFQDKQFPDGLAPMRVARAYKDRLTSFYKHLTSEKKIISEVDDYYLLKTLDLCDRYGIQYYFYPGPLWSGLYDHSLGKAYFDLAIKELKAIEKNEQSFTLLSATISVYPFELLTNSPEHLNKEGSKLYSEVVGNHIKSLP